MVEKLVLQIASERDGSADNWAAESTLEREIDGGEWGIGECLEAKGGVECSERAYLAYPAAGGYEPLQGRSKLSYRYARCIKDVPDTLIARYHMVLEQGGQPKREPMSPTQV